jgi:hypothetical protein
LVCGAGSDKGKSQGKDEMRGALHFGGKSAGSGRDDDFPGWLWWLFAVEIEGVEVGGGGAGADQGDVIGSDAAEEEVDGLA